MLFFPPFLLREHIVSRLRRFDLADSGMFRDRRLICRLTVIFFFFPGASGARLIEREKIRNNHNSNAIAISHSVSSAIARQSSIVCFAFLIPVGTPAFAASICSRRVFAPFSVCSFPVFLFFFVGAYFSPFFFFFLEEHTFPSASLR